MPSLSIFSHLDSTYLTIFGYIIHDHSCFIPSMDCIFFHLMNPPMVIIINQSMKIVTKFWAHKEWAFDKSKNSCRMSSLFWSWSSPVAIFFSLETGPSNTRPTNTKFRLVPAMHMQWPTTTSECKDSRDDHFQACQRDHKSGAMSGRGGRADLCDDFMFGSPDEIGDEILEHLNETESSWSNAIESSLADANACVRAAEKSGMFRTLEENAMVVDFNDSDHHRDLRSYTRGNFNTLPSPPLYHWTPVNSSGLQWTPVDSGGTPTRMTVD